MALEWDGPASQLYDAIGSAVNDLHYYVVEKTSTLGSSNFVAVTMPSTAHRAIIADNGVAGFYRVRLLGR